MMSCEPQPSAWIVRWSHLVPQGAQVLDVACGTGRHSRWFFERNHHVTAVDKARTAIKSVANFATTFCADIEEGSWPFAGQTFGAVIVTNYLWRPLLPTLVASVAEGGVLLYETFAQGHETVGRPVRQDFLLGPGELLQACAGLHVVAYEHGFLPHPARFIQRIAAVRVPQDADAPPQIALAG